MNVRFSARATRDFGALAPRLKTAVRKQLALLQENLRHPSLQAKKYDEATEPTASLVRRVLF